MNESKNTNKRIVPQLENVCKIAENIKTLLIGNKISSGGKIIENSTLKMFMDNTKEMPVDDKIKFMTAMIKSMSSPSTPNIYDDELVQSCQKLEEMIPVADNIEKTYILNLIDGIIFGNELANEAMEKIMDAWNTSKTHDNCLDNLIGGLNAINDRISDLEINQVFFESLFREHKSKFKEIDDDVNKLSQLVFDVKKEIAPLISGRFEEDLIESMWTRISKYEKLTLFCNMVRKALHQRFFISHFISAGGVIPGTNYGTDVLQLAAGQIPIFGPLLILAIKTGLAAKDVINDESQKLKADKFVACTDSLKFLNLLPELLALFLTCSYEEQLLCLTNKSLINQYEPCAAIYSIDLIEKVIKANIPSNFTVSSLLELAIFIINNVPVQAEKDKSAPFLKTFSSMVRKGKPDLSNSRLNITKKVHRDDTNFKDKTWATSCIYFKSSIKTQNESGQLLFEKSTVDSKKFLYRWAINNNTDFAFFERYPHPYSSNTAYSSLFENDPFILVRQKLLDLQETKDEEMEIDGAPTDLPEQNTNIVKGLEKFGSFRDSSNGIYLPIQPEEGEKMRKKAFARRQ